MQHMEIVTYWEAIRGTLAQRGLLRPNAGDPCAVAIVEPDRVAFILDMQRLGGVSRENWLNQDLWEQWRAALQGRRAIVADKGGLAVVVARRPGEVGANRLPQSVSLKPGDVPPGDYKAVLGVARSGPVVLDLARADRSLLVGGTSVVQNSKVLSVAPLSTKVGVVVQNSDVFSGTMYFAAFANSTGNLAGYIAQTGTTTVSYTSVSDYRLKENVTPMTGALEKVQALKPCVYTWKEDKSAGQGFIAHELQAVIPDCVVGEKDAVDKDGNPRYQGIDTSFLVATLTAAIQELKALTDTQASTITALTARITALENK